ncbi:MAG: homoserine dehydrogenase [Nitrospiria bacterium]
MKSSINIGFIGFGTVASGAIKILLSQKNLLARRLGNSIEIRKIADRNITDDRGIALPEGLLTTDIQAVLNDPEIDIMVELIGGTTTAKTVVLEALNKGKHVVTANKALLAIHGEEIFDAASSLGVEVGFEASVCGGIPIVRAMKEALASEKILTIHGIMNGTCNYIFSKMRDEGRSFSDILKDAQRLGFAEADPTLDVGGGDSAHKLAILASLAFGTDISLKEIYTEGIEKITPIDIAFADEFGYEIKLLAITKQRDQEIEARVHPTMISKATLLSKIDGVFNAVVVVGETVGELLFYGQGAGSLPTGSAVVNDLIDISRHILSESPTKVPARSFVKKFRKHLRIKPIGEITSLYYLRFMVRDQPCVLSRISGILGEFNISIASVIQQGRKIGGHVPLVMMTHLAKEKNLRNAILEIDQLDDVSGETLFIRIEGEDPL